MLDSLARAHFRPSRMSNTLLMMRNIVMCVYVHDDEDDYEDDDDDVCTVIPAARAHNLICSR